MYVCMYVCLLVPISLRSTVSGPWKGTESTGPRVRSLQGVLLSRHGQLCLKHLVDCHAANFAPGTEVGAEKP